MWDSLPHDGMQRGPQQESATFHIVKANIVPQAQGSGELPVGAALGLDVATVGMMPDDMKRVELNMPLANGWWLLKGRKYTYQRKLLRKYRMPMTRQERKRGMNRGGYRAFQR